VTGPFSSSTGVDTPMTTVRLRRRPHGDRHHDPQESSPVIRLTRLNGEHFVLNVELIQRVEGHPDTVVTLLDDTKYVVIETVDQVVRAVRDYRASIQAVAFRMDRGEYHPQVPHTVDGATTDSSVVPFPTREER
jgi:flagellar protein FlbD